MTHACHHEPRWPYAGRGHRDPQPGEPALRVERLEARYPSAGRPALLDVRLQVDIGSRVALVGPNGAGKSTLLKTVAGLIKPAAGEVRVYGNPVGACHHRTAYLPQRADIDWQFPVTVAQLVETGRYVHLGWFRSTTRHDRRRVRAALEKLGVAELADRQIGDLSGGQQQRVLLARAVVQEADLFLLDEPLTGVDETTRELVDSVLAEHAARGGSVLAATHDLGRLAKSFDRAIHLRDGRIERSAGDFDVVEARDASSVEVAARATSGVDR